MSKEKLAEYKEAFKMFDMDNNGTISCQELGEVMRRLNNNFTEIQDMVKLFSLF